MILVSAALPDLALSPDVPITVRWLGQPYAVIADEGDNWRLRSHKDGKIRVVLKTATEEVPVTPEMHVINEDEAEVRFPSENGAAAPEARPTPLTNPSDQAALIRLTQRRMETLRVERDQLQNKIADLEQKYQGAVNFLRTLGIDAPAEAFRAPASKPSTPSASSGGRRIAAKLSDAELDKLRMTWLDLGPTAKAGAVQTRLQEKHGINMRYGTVFYYLNKFKAEGTAP